ncbi:MAG: Wzz/FepE/Etk N-terminal domain-containing protein [Candidatus Cloacimonetes bacterium]|nr:Wzz/FepE/Etk N-terminal domain-containing protein [Candidatus Cloacimonadota bacterium]
MNTKKIDLLDLCLILVSNKKIIICFTLIMSIIAITYSLVVDEKWSSSATVDIIDNADNFSLTNSLFDGLGLEGSGSVKGKSLKYSAVLKTNRISKKAIKEFDLISYFNIVDKDSLKVIDTAIKSLHEEILEIYLNEDTFFMTIILTTKDKQMSKKMADFYLNELIEYAQDNKSNLGKQKKELLETRINEIEKNILVLSEELKVYQENNNIVDIVEQAKASLSNYSVVLNEYFINEIELNYTSRVLPNSIQHKNLQEKNKSITEILKKFEVDNKDLPYLLSLNSSNTHLFTIQQKVYALELLETILKTIYPQYELARIDEIDSRDMFEVLDYPKLSGYRTSPKRALICIVTFFVSMLFSSVLILFVKLMPNDDIVKIKAVWKNLFR